MTYVHVLFNKKYLELLGKMSFKVAIYHDDCCESSI